MPQSTRKIGKWACDACKLRKVKCSSESPCSGCVTAGILCTFNKRPLVRGPKGLRAQTIRRITATQQQQQQQQQEQQFYGWGSNSGSPGERRTGQTPPAMPSSTPSPSNDTYQVTTPGSTTLPSISHNIDEPHRTSTSSMVLRLCVYRLRLFPVWPIVDVEEVMGNIHRDPDNMAAYALANAIGAATIAQLKLDSPENGDMATAASMEAECQRAIELLRKDGGDSIMDINALRVSFFLHVYHENRSPGGSRSLLYLREAITIAQIMGLHREATYSSLSAREQQMRQRIFSLLFITERGVAMLHKLPVILRYNARFINLDEADDESHVLPAFKKLMSLFLMFDQSGAFDMLHNSDEIQLPPYEGMPALNRNSFSLLQCQLREASIQPRETNVVQMADICVTTQWMQAILWRASMSRRSTLDSPQQQITSLSHPIQIAKEFLETMSRLPSSAIEAHGPAMEYKIYEIARAVADSITTEFNGQPISLDIPRAILLRLQSKLASCRGGNKILLPLLHARISEALLRPSPRDYKISDFGPSSKPLSRDTMPYSSQQPQTLPLPSPPPLGSAEIYEEQGNLEGRELPQDPTDNVSTLRVVTWDHNIPDILFSSDQYPFTQAQVFQGSFDNIDSTGTIEFLLNNNTMLDSGESWESQFGGAAAG